MVYCEMKLSSTPESTRAFISTVPCLLNVMIVITIDWIMVLLALLATTAVKFVSFGIFSKHFFFLVQLDAQ